MWRQFSDDNDSGDIMSDFCSTFTNFIINLRTNGAVPVGALYKPNYIILEIKWM